VETKSRAGRRVIGMPAQLMAWLTSHQKVQEKEREPAADM
jgi:integrase